MIWHQEDLWKRYEDRRYKKLSDSVEIILFNLAIRHSPLNSNELLIEGFTQDELANYLGVSRQQVTVILNRLKIEGKIDYDRKKIILKRNEFKDVLGYNSLRTTI